MQPAAARFPLTISWLPCSGVDFPSLGVRYKNCSCSLQCHLRRVQFQESKGRLELGGNVHFRLLRSKYVARLHSTTMCGTASDRVPASPARELSDSEKQLWQRSCEPVVNLGFSAEEADSMIAKAFGWKRSPYWGEAREPTVPEPDSITAVISYLRELGMADPDIAKVVKKLPEVLGLLVEEDMKKNVAALEKTWGISGNVLKNLLLRTPGALGFTVDCRGDCQALCTRCWARL